MIKQEWGETGALVVGRHLYDMTNAWGGRNPMNVTTVVLTHHLPDERPVVLGSGKHPFEGLTTPVQFDGPISIVEGKGVTHLRYRVRK